MSETRKNHLTIDGAQAKEDEHVASYKAIPESDTGADDQQAKISKEFRSSKTSLHKSKDKLSADGAEEKLLQKDDEAKITTRVDMADAKYVVGDHRNGDAKIELDANKRQFSGLTKEELMKYAEDPFWVRLRWFMFCLFWALWLCMLAGAIAIIIRAPKCAAPTPKTWNEKGPLVDLALSMDDYREAEEHLSKLQKYEVTGVFASVCQNSYEVLEDTTCLDQFKVFAEKAKKFGIKVIVDLTANFVPDTHTWFRLSENRSEEYKDYFLWVKSAEYDSDLNSTTPKPPNDWVSTVDGPAWSWSETRKEYFLHQYGAGLPDLNFNNSNVVRQFDEVIRLFMRAGAGGIRLHKARRLVVNTVPGSQFPHTGAGSDPGADHSQHPFWRHKHTTDQPQLDALLPHWAHLVARASSEPTVFTLAEPTRPELFVLNRNTSYLRPPSAAPVAVLPSATGAAAVALLRERLPRWPALQLTDQDADEELAAFAMLLPAAPVLTLEQLNDRDNDTSLAESLKQAVTLRSDSRVQHGQWLLADVPVHGSNDTMLAVARWRAGQLGYVCVYNAGARARASLAALRALPAALSVHHVSPATRRATNYTGNLAVNSSDVLVPAKSSVMFSYVPKDSALN